MRAGLVALAALLVTGAAIPYFTYQRDIQPASSDGQHYFVVDPVLWQHARPELRDLRVYAGEREVPYNLAVERGGSETERQELRVLQPALVRSGTQFLLDLSGVPEYDRVELKLAARNFVARARVEGQNDPRGAAWALLGTTTVYDLTQEKLGQNNTLVFPPATYRYLRITIDHGVSPADVQGAAAAITRSEQALWRTVTGNSVPVQQGRDTVVTFSPPANVPVERVVFEIAAAAPNFRRAVEVQGEEGRRLGSGEITRIHMQRGGQKIDVEQTFVAIRGANPGTIKAVIHNQDDAPLTITAARLEQYERRIYFDASAGTPYRLYYGDDKLDAPVYDYARLFRKGADALPLLLSGEARNSSHTPRPDERPWSERHPAVLWAAVLAAVLILAGIALRSLRATAS